MPSRCRVGAEATSSQTRRCQVAEEMRGPPSGRAQRGGGEEPPARSADLDPLAESKVFCGWV
jgi:hypothetical protein